LGILWGGRNYVMSELRHDPIQREWVIVAPERERRIKYTRLNGSDEESCPFCDGHEDTLPHIIKEVAENNENADYSWRIRVIPNRFPVLKVEGRLKRSAKGIYDHINGIGAHEIIIDTPRHDQSFADLSVDHMAQLFGVYRERLDDLLRDIRLRYISVFRNDGIDDGATVRHSYSQLVAMPTVPNDVVIKLRSAREHYLIKERCIFCDVIDQEVNDKLRIVAQNEHFIAFCPYASRFPFEVQVMPLRHMHDYRQAGYELFVHLSSLIKDVLARFKVALDDPAYSLAIHTAPNITSKVESSCYWETITEDFHWHMSIVPHSVTQSGIEMISGMFVNTTAPETAAKVLREVQLKV